MLRRGSEGTAVRRLQRRLIEVGFPPGPVDGIFGPATERAVRAFQASEGFLVDGIVGPVTGGALGLTIKPDAPVRARSVTVDVVQQGFPSTPRGNIANNLPFVLDALKAADLADKPMILMALATIRAETEGFVPISEFQSVFNTSPGGEPFDLYDNRSDLGNRGKPDGERFRGRGYIQLTGRFNYEQIGQRIGLGTGLVTDPERANVPDIAASILAAFLKDRERPIREALLDHNLKAARKLVNGGSHGITRFTDAFRRLDAAIDG